MKRSASFPIQEEPETGTDSHTKMSRDGGGAVFRTAAGGGIRVTEGTLAPRLYGGSGEEGQGVMRDAHDGPSGAQVKRSIAELCRERRGNEGGRLSAQEV